MQHVGAVSPECCCATSCATVSSTVAHANRPSYNQSSRPCNAASQLHVCVPQAATCMCSPSSYMYVFPKQPASSRPGRVNSHPQTPTPAICLGLNHAWEYFILSYNAHSTEAPVLGRSQDRQLVPLHSASVAPPHQLCALARLQQPFHWDDVPLRLLGSLLCITAEAQGYQSTCTLRNARTWRG